VSAAQKNQLRIGIDESKDEKAMLIPGNKTVTQLVLI
jgi:hypothetical protein